LSKNVDLIQSKKIKNDESQDNYASEERALKMADEKINSIDQLIAQNQ
jgi:hypothetical protein